MRPDLVITNPDGVQTFVEIFVTHRVEDAKHDLLEERNISCLEIDLSGIDLDSLDEASLITAILDEAPRYWVHHARARDWEEDAAVQWATNLRTQAAELATAVSSPARLHVPAPTARMLDDLIADHGLEPYVGLDLGLASWFDLPPRYWQARLLKLLVIDRIQETSDLGYGLSPTAYTFYDPRRDPELLPLIQPWPDQRCQIETSNPYVVEELERAYPDLGSPRQLVCRFFETLIAAPDRPGSSIAARIIGPPASRPFAAFRIHRPWGDYILRKKRLLDAYLRAGRRRPLRHDDFRRWYTLPLEATGERPRLITARGGAEFIRLIARVEAIANMVAGGSGVIDLLRIEEPGFREQLEWRPVTPAPLTSIHSPNEDQFYCCPSMATFHRHQDDVTATLVAIARQRLGVGAQAFLTRPSDDLGGLPPLEFAVDVPTMQFAMRRLPPPPGVGSRRRLW